MKTSLALTLAATCSGLITAVITFALFHFMGEQLPSPTVHIWNEIVPYIMFLFTGFSVTWTCLSDEAFVVGSIFSVGFVIIGIFTGLIGPLASFCYLLAIVASSLAVCIVHWFGHQLECDTVFYM